MPRPNLVGTRRFRRWMHLNALSVAASEVSSILESRIAGAGSAGDVQETGRVLSEYKYS